MNRFYKFIAEIGKYALGVLLMGWTFVHTLDILQKTNPSPDNNFLPWYGGIVFEGGALTWYLLFRKKSSGIGQHAVALLAFVADLLLVFTAFALDNLLSPTEIAYGRSIAKYTVIIATIVNVSAFFAFEILQPEIWEELMRNLHVADIISKGLEKAQMKLETQSDQVAEELSEAHVAAAIQKARSMAPLMGSDHRAARRYTFSPSPLTDVEKAPRPFNAEAIKPPFEKNP